MRTLYTATRLSLLGITWHLGVGFAAQTKNKTFDTISAAREAKAQISATFGINPKDVEITGVIFQDGIGDADSTNPFDFARFYVLSDSSKALSPIYGDYQPTLAISLNGSLEVLLIEKEANFNASSPLPIHHPSSGFLLFDQDIPYDSPEADALKELVGSVALEAGESLRYNRSSSTVTFKMKSINRTQWVHRFLKEVAQKFGSATLNLSGINYLSPLHAKPHKIALGDVISDVDSLRTLSRRLIERSDLSPSEIHRSCRALLKRAGP